MIHSLTKKRYPNCPFITDSLNNSKKDYLLKVNVIDITHEDLNTRIDNHIQVYLNKIISESKGKTILKIINQNIPLFETTHYINFVCAAYRDDIGTFINREYDSIISWTIIPIDFQGAILPNQNYSIDLMPKNITNSSSNSKQKYENVLVGSDVRNLDPLFHDGNNDDHKIESDVMRHRASKRGLYVRDNISNSNTKNEPNKNKEDIYEYTEPQTKNIHQYTPVKSQIQLDNKTRASAQLIRDRLSNPYKAHRLKNNPDLFKRSLKIDNTIKNIGDVNVDRNNSKHDIFRSIIPRTQFSLTNENISVKYIDNSLKFYNSAKIILNSNKEKHRSFLSVMFNKNTLHITLHMLNYV